MTVSETAVVWMRPPELPQIVIWAKPSDAAVEAVNVSVLVPVVVLGLKDAVTPAGRPRAERATEPVKLFMPVTAMVLTPALPWTTLRLLGEAERE